MQTAAQPSPVCRTRPEGSFGSYRTTIKNTFLLKKSILLLLSKAGVPGRFRHVTMFRGGIADPERLKDRRAAEPSTAVARISLSSSEELSPRPFSLEVASSHVLAALARPCSAYLQGEEEACESLVGEKESLRCVADADHRLCWHRPGARFSTRYPAST